MISKSREQENLFHARCGELALFWSENSQPLFGIYYNYSKEDVKTTLKRAYGVYIEYHDPILKKPVKRLKSISQYSKKELSNLLNETEALGVFQGCKFKDLK